MTGPDDQDLDGETPETEDLEGSDVDGAEGLDDVPETPEELEEDLEEEEIERVAAKAPGPRKVGAVRRLYRGETSMDFVGRRKWWFTLSSLIIVAGLVSLGVRGLNLGITFKGGQAWTTRSNGVTQVQALDAVQAAGLTQATVEVLGTGTNQSLRITADLNALPIGTRSKEKTKIIDVLAKLTHTKVSVTTVGPTWGGQVTQKAVIALIVFLVLVAVYISFRFEPKMAVAAFVALLHDLLITAGVYSLAGFQVTPDTVIAVLTILGYSLYDTVVVFDRVRDNSRGLGASGRMTYSDMVNLSMNQTLARSINTSLVAIIPVLAILLIGADLLGATTLQNYGLALFIGLLSGAYSSIFIASPILAILKEREPRYTAVRQRIETRGDRLGLLTPSAAAALVGAGASASMRSQRSGAMRPGQARAQARPGQARRGPAPGAAQARQPTTAASPTGPVANGATTPARPAGSPRPGGSGRPPANRRPQQRSRKGGKGGKRRR